MNRLLAVCLVSLAVASLAACGGGAAPKSQSMPEVQASALPVHADATDDLFEAVTPSAILSEMRAGAEAGAGMKAALSAGADPNARHATHGGTPLHVAAGEFAPLSVIVALLEGGADPNAHMTNDRFTPLHLAAKYQDNPSVIVALIEAGADPGARTVRGETPLHLAASGNANLPVITALIEAGADPNARMERGVTPLHLAAWFNSNPSVIVALLEAGADPGALDELGFTPVDYADSNEALKETDAYYQLLRAYYY